MRVAKAKAKWGKKGLIRNGDAFLLRRKVDMRFGGPIIIDQTLVLVEI